MIVIIHVLEVLKTAIVVVIVILNVITTSKYFSLVLVSAAMTLMIQYDNYRFQRQHLVEAESNKQRAKQKESSRKQKKGKQAGKMRQAKKSESCKRRQQTKEQTENKTTAGFKKIRQNRNLKNRAPTGLSTSPCLSCLS